MSMSRTNSTDGASSTLIDHPLCSEALQAIEQENEEKALQKEFLLNVQDDITAKPKQQQVTASAIYTASTESKVETTVATTATVTTATINHSLPRRQPTNSAKSSWLPVRPFSFFASEQDDAATLAGQNTIGYALWSRLYEQRKEDADLLAFLQSRKAILLLPQETIEDVTKIERTTLIDHILVRQAVPSAQLTESTTTDQFKLTSLSGLEVAIDKKQHLLWQITSPNTNSNSVSEDTIEIVNDHLEITLHKHSIIGVVITTPLISLKGLTIKLPTSSNSVNINRQHLSVTSSDATPPPSPGFTHLMEWKDIIKYLDSFVLEFGKTCRNADPIKSADTCSEEYQQFIEQVKTMIESADHLVKDLNMDQALEWMEGYLTIELYPCIFGPSNDTLDDERLASRCMSLHLLHVGLKQLGLAVSEAGQQILDHMVNEARIVLEQMDVKQSPIDKLEAIIQLHELIVGQLNGGKLKLTMLAPTSAEFDTKELAEMPVSSSSSLLKKKKKKKSSAGSPNADQLFPLLIYIIIKTMPSRLISNVRYIQRYRHRNALKSKYAYCLTNMFAAISFLEAIDMKTLGLAPVTESSLTVDVAASSELSAVEKDKAVSVFTLPALSIPEASQPVLMAAFRGGRDATVAVADGVNKAITGAVDIGFSVFGRLLNARSGSTTTATTSVTGKPPSINGTISDTASIQSETSQARISNNDHGGGTEGAKEAASELSRQIVPKASASTLASQYTVDHESTAATATATATVSNDGGAKRTEPVELDLCQVLPPIHRFVDCTIEELKVNDVAELLEDYKRLATIVNRYRLELAKQAEY
ncbi:hypothetical protein BDF19DRAFT_455087 [Syncephalis fuscata]|nr:hypothetical protein BDF19DRAFT_455087 [Syncephalis fuscata]